MSTPHSKIKLIFDKQRHVERLDFSSVVEVFNANTIAAEGLRQLCDTVQILFQGYDHDSRLPFVIPELRLFLRRLRKAWPYASFFCDLHSSFISVDAFAHVDHAQIVEKAGTDEIHFWIGANELQQYVTQSHRIIQVLGNRSRMPKLEIRQRILRFDNYIALNFGPFHTARTFR
jgi:hypothetical protein